MDLRRAQYWRVGSAATTTLAGTGQRTLTRTRNTRPRAHSHASSCTLARTPAPRPPPPAPRPRSAITEVHLVREMVFALRIVPTILTSSVRRGPARPPVPDPVPIQPFRSWPTFQRALLPGQVVPLSATTAASVAAHKPVLDAVRALRALANGVHPPLLRPFVDGVSALLAPFDAWLSEVEHAYSRQGALPAAAATRHKAQLCLCHLVSALQAWMRQRRTSRGRGRRSRGACATWASRWWRCTACCGSAGPPSVRGGRAAVCASLPTLSDSVRLFRCHPQCGRARIRPR